MVYVLGFAGNVTYSAAVRKANHTKAFAGKEFFDWLIANQYLIQIQDGSESVGNFVVYFNSIQEFKHIGILLDKKRVKSKWGELGLYDHEILDVPANYGNDVKYFEPIKYDNAMFAFKQYTTEIV